MSSTDTLSQHLTERMAAYNTTMEKYFIAPVLAELKEMEARLVEDFSADLVLDSSRLNFDEFARNLRKLHLLRISIENIRAAAASNPLLGF